MIIQVGRRQPDVFREVDGLVAMNQLKLSRNKQRKQFSTWHKTKIVRTRTKPFRDCR